MSYDEGVVRRMGELLRSGAVMLGESCPICSLPLFRLKSGEVICPTHGRVHIVRSDSEILSLATITALDELEKFTVNTINMLRRSLEEGNAGPDKQSIKQLMYWLNILEKVRRIKIIIEHSERALKSKER